MNLGIFPYMKMAYSLKIYCNHLCCVFAWKTWIVSSYKVTAAFIPRALYDGPNVYLKMKHSILCLRKFIVCVDINGSEMSTNK